MTEQPADEPSDLRNQVIRLTKKRDEALKRAEKAEADQQAAEELLREAEQGATVELCTRVAELQRQFNALQASIAEAKKRKKVADQVATNGQEAAEATRIALQDLTNQKKETERTLREITNAVRDAKQLLTEVGNFTGIEEVSCGCKVMVQKGPNCRPNSMMTALHPCTSLVDDGEEPIRHVKEL